METDQEASLKPSTSSLASHHQPAVFVRLCLTPQTPKSLKPVRSRPKQTYLPSRDNTKLPPSFGYEVLLLRVPNQTHHFPAIAPIILKADCNLTVALRTVETRTCLR